MTTRDLFNVVSPVASINPAAATATQTGAGVDLRFYEAALLIIALGLWTDGTHTFTVEESDDDGSSDAYAAVAAANIQGTLPVITDATNDNQTHEVGVFATKRWIRIVNTVSGATTGLVSGASVVRGFPRHAPVT